MSRPRPPIEVPATLAAAHVTHFGAAGRAWTAGLPALAEQLLERWALTPDGPAASGAVALVLPVLRADGTAAVLKLQPVDEETGGEPAALRAWRGEGAVRLLEHDPETGTMLLERLDATRSLATVPDADEALRLLSERLAQLTATPAPPGLRRLADIAADLLRRAPAAREHAGDPASRALLDHCAGALAEVLPDGAGDRLLHWDLHYGNVLAPLPDGDRRADWLAIDPKPLAGDPAFELLPALHNRWEEVTAIGDVARAVLRRFDLMTEILGLDRDRAVAWTQARILQNLLWEIESGHDGQSSHAAPDRRVAEVLRDRPRR
ncbi:hydroxyurea phosphotransferase [Streptomyces sp. 3MP-14]|uniref:Hydroxyurea phosphotransferase n=1 Tax=Streptomyces mimosae TaxID=2586635 RepID=A0A5N6AB18_9ACTN|nr:MULTISPECIES: aminoglycoside phosphotransferase family protein [Streptomyces]KAB8164688.1 hydroxyurea phosphotransferase [Streptomyces mimosae]KAB8175604.1 hydroxyurea phosphotransferase [Streptomyces sp. 3MP-14]